MRSFCKVIKGAVTPFLLLGFVFSGGLNFWGGIIVLYTPDGSADMNIVLCLALWLISLMCFGMVFLVVSDYLRRRNR